ncbi:MAG TPA: UDP-N-acetylmuramoyl-tripeptide--D-alanyl-D-alanine ligase [Acholeplasmataceae bacterium]|nr:UDP-N-acetylmuramoyl-tripeptide--D-alanyl-D-alanine ligase [Acholeplasmataceae bacterium]
MKIKKLHFTPRIIRLTSFIIISWTALGTILMLVFPFPQLISLLALFIVISPLLVFASSICMVPIERLIVKGYYVNAKRKLSKYKPSIIGITGSCGKTSVKNYLYDLIKEKHIVYKSPKSYNTLNGISMTINEYLFSYNNLFILEMGATKVGDIEKLVNFARPKYAVVTEIVPQHLETFKTTENIVYEKMKIVEGLPSDGVAFLNYDNEYIKNYQIKNSCKVITYGTNPNCDFYASNINMTLDKLTFDLHFQGLSYQIETKLLGRHNVLNLLAAISVANTIGLSIEEIIDAINDLNQVSHRLNLRYDRELIILDDAYNSNVKGFLSALEVLSLSSEYKTLLTPGIVELGDKAKEISFELAKEIVKVCDEVILIENDAAKYLQESLESLNYKNIRVAKSFKEGYALVKKGIVLIENDLTDNYFI